MAYTSRVVRRDEVDRSSSASRRSSPAGASPVSVSAGAPSSRPQASGENPVAQAGCQKPLRRKPARGPQHQVKPAASTELPPESRTDHVAVKATSAMPQSGGARVAGLGGVEGAARVQGEERNTRGPSAPPSSRHSDAYKPMAKARRAQRASEGTIVASSLATNNARGAKGSCGGHGDGASTREGMTGTPGSNAPGGPSSSDKVRQLQRRLWVAAKRSPERRFHALMDRIWRSDVLQEAGRRVKQNRGAAGVDGATLAVVEQSGVERVEHPLHPVLLDDSERLAIDTRRAAVRLHPPPCLPQDVTPVDRSISAWKRRAGDRLAATHSRRCNWRTLSITGR